GDHRREGRGQAGVQQQQDVVLRQQLLGVGGRLAGLGGVVRQNEVDLLAGNAAGGVDAIDIEAERVRRRGIGRGGRTRQSPGQADGIGVLGGGGRRQQQC